MSDFIFLEEPVSLETWVCMFEQVRAENGEGKA